MSNLDTLFDTFSSTVQHLIDNIDSNITINDIEKLNDLINKCSLQLSILTNLSSQTKEVLLSIKKLLLLDNIPIQNKNDSTSGIDYEMLLEFLNNLIKLVHFEDILKTFSLEDIEMALKSDIPPLVQSACLIVALSYPKGIFASTIIFDILLDIYFKEDTQIEIINAIDKIWESLLSDQLVRDNILKNNYLLLDIIKKQLDSIPMSRLLNLLNGLLSHFKTKSDFNAELFIVSLNDMWKIIDKDILLFLHVVKYYTEWFSFINSIEITIEPRDKLWLLSYLKPIILWMGEIFDKREENPEIMAFAQFPLFKFFQNVSMLHDLTIFQQLDKDYIHISMENEYLDDYLSFVNPEYLFGNYKSIIEDYIIVSPSRLPIIRNLISNPETFNLIKNELNSDAILSMPYPEQMVLLQKISQYDYAVKYLVYYLPKVMTNLIDNGDNHIKEPETIQLRTEIIDKLMGFSQEDLNIWYLSLKDEYIKIRSNVDPNKSVQTSIASEFL